MVNSGGTEGEGGKCKCFGINFSGMPAGELPWIWFDRLRRLSFQRCTYLRFWLKHIPFLLLCNTLFSFVSRHGRTHEPSKHREQTHSGSYLFRLRCVPISLGTHTILIWFRLRKLPDSHMDVHTREYSLIYRYEQCGKTRCFIRCWAWFFAMLTVQLSPIMFPTCFFFFRATVSKQVPRMCWHSISAHVEAKAMRLKWIRVLHSNI